MSKNSNWNNHPSRGVVVDVEFDDKAPASDLRRLTCKTRRNARLRFEVAQHLDEHTVRAIAIAQYRWLKRGDEVDCHWRTD